ncbi:calmodulin-like protein containing EF hand domain [Trypanosoma grayi]|uniref:calmodulin-like protein containing EF hand domain n=1 Tax=Trypanosoma grayi TaxID=71804 RepID=UPI0004F4B4EF|nr:calmodulin-like protein containing EF hand domain [Trypanosoma grayi]KEG12701.1 calmodulin-like protein containing EF hand domain [Trypanosoma grayi]
MVFFVNAAADVRGTKQNLRLQFPACPTLLELASAVELHFTAAAAAAAAAEAGVAPFRVDLLMLFDEYALRWAELYSSAQLSTDCQVYAFHTLTAAGTRGASSELPAGGVVDSPGVIMPPSTTVVCAAPARDVSPSLSSLDWVDTDIVNSCGSNSTSSSYHYRHLAGGIGSPAPTDNCRPMLHRPTRVATRRNQKMGLGERLRAVFDTLDSHQKGYLLYTDIKRAVDAQRTVFMNYSAEVLFVLADQDGDDCVSYRDWVSFAVEHPTVVDALFYAMQPAQHHDHHYKKQQPQQKKKTQLSSSSSSLSLLDGAGRQSEGLFERSRATQAYEEARLAADAARLNALRVVGRELAALRCLRGRQW